jgi:hypothetical protein
VIIVDVHPDTLLVRDRTHTAITEAVITVSARPRTPHLPERALTAITCRL